MTTTLDYLHDFQLWYPHGYDSGLGERDRTPTATPTRRAIQWAVEPEAGGDTTPQGVLPSVTGL